MKSLKDLTPEIEAKIPQYIERTTKDLYSGKDHELYDLSHTYKYIERIYEIAGFKKPVVIVADNPLEYRLLFNVLKADLLKSIIGKAFLVKNQLYDQLDDQLRDQLRDQLYVQLKDQLSCQLKDQLDDQLDGQLYGQLYDQLNGQFSDQLNGQLDGQLSDQLDGQLSDQLNDQLDVQLRGQLSCQLSGQLNGQLSGQFSDQLSGQLNGQLDGQLNGQLSGQLNGQLDGQLIGQLIGQLRGQLNGQLYSDSHWLFLCNIYSRCYLTWYKFIKDEFNLPCSAGDLLDELYELINKTVISRCYFTKGYVLVLKTPSKCVFNGNVLHNCFGPAISYKGNGDIYVVNGRTSSKNIVDCNFTKEDFLKEENEDVKASMATVLRERRGEEGLLDFLGAEVVDEKTISHKADIISDLSVDVNGKLVVDSKGEAVKKEIVRLYKTKEKYSFLQDRNGNTNQPYCWSEMTCPSTGSTYLLENSADFDCAIEAMKFLRPSFVPMDVDYSWKSFNN